MQDLPMNLRYLYGNAVAPLTSMRAFPIVLSAALLLPLTAAAQSRVPPEADRGAPAAAAPREAAPPPPPPQAAPPPPPPAASRPERAPQPERGAVPRNAGQPRTAAPPRTAAEPSPAPQRGPARVPPEARRDRGGNGTPRTGTAVRRPPNQPPRIGDDRRGDGRVYVPPYVYNNYYYYPRRYYPYGYGAFGLGYFYYDPYYWGSAYGYPAYTPFRGYDYGYATGELRLDVSPRNAEVYVDGYFAGHVDDFDGIFQSLELEEGTYRIEIVAPGFAPLQFDVRIYAGRKITYRGDLARGRP
jgi:hypothetical protein